MVKRLKKSGFRKWVQTDTMQQMTVSSTQFDTSGRNDMLYRRTTLGFLCVSGVCAAVSFGVGDDL